MIRANSPDGSTRDLKTTKDLVRAACGPLLEVLADETVSVIHRSFTVYLMGTTRPDDASGYPVLQMGAAHTQLALACLRYFCGGCLDAVGVQVSEDDNGYESYNSEIYGSPIGGSGSRIEVKLRLKHPWSLRIRRPYPHYLSKLVSTFTSATHLGRLRCLGRQPLRRF